MVSRGGARVDKLELKLLQMLKTKVITCLSLAVIQQSLCSTTCANPKTSSTPLIGEETEYEMDINCRYGVIFFCGYYKN